LTNDLNKKYIYRLAASYENTEIMCLTVNINDIEAKLKFQHFTCPRKIGGRMVCEFEKTPFFKIKGLCVKSPIDRMFQLIDPRPGQGNYPVVCVFIPSPVRVGTLLSEVPGTPIGASFFEFELKPTGNDSADQTQHEFQHHIV